MTKRSFFLTFVSAFALLTIAAPSRPTRAASFDHCIRAGEAQWNGDRLETPLRNTCRQPVRVHWCVRQKDDDLKCGVNPILRPRATTTARAIDAKRPVELLIEACEVGGDCRVSR
ncbi:MAG: hypothetical protein GWN73_00600 [Actinobacteria bacterium]|nr:hypothetical protein [Actinomycetota bacterium]